MDLTEDLTSNFAKTIYISLWQQGDGNISKSSVIGDTIWRTETLEYIHIVFATTHIYYKA